VEKASVLDRDDRLSCECLDKLDLPRPEGARKGPTQLDRADRAAALQKRRGQEAAVSVIVRVRLPLAELVFGELLHIRDVEEPGFPDRARCDRPMGELESLRRE